MSQNTDEKDKILIFPNPNSTRQGSIVLDPTDAAGFMEHFSRLNPGDEVSGTFKAQLDEAGQKTVKLSITELTVDKPEDDESGGGEDGDEESAAVQVIKNGEGVPENEDNIPPDSMPTH